MRYVNEQRNYHDWHDSQSSLVDEAEVNNVTHDSLSHSLGTFPQE